MLLEGQGRTLLLAYAFLMVLSGPMQNFNNNIHVMSNSATCGQQMTYNVTKEVVDMAMAPVKGKMNIHLILLLEGKKIIHNWNNNLHVMSNNCGQQVTF